MSGAGGGDEPAGVDTDRFVLGGSVQWGELTEAIFGVWLRLAATALIGGILFVTNAISRFIAWVSGGYATLISIPFDEGAGIITLSAVVAGDWIGALGLFAWPVAVFASMLIVLIILWGVNRLG